MRHPELGLHDVSVGALRHGLGQPGLHGIQPRADDAPQRLLEGDALVLSALEIIAHFDPLMWVVENPATGLLKTRPFMERLPWVDETYCKYGTPYTGSRRGCGPTCAGGRGEVCAGPAAAAARGRMAGTSGLRSGGLG